MKYNGYAACQVQILKSEMAKFTRTKWRNLLYNKTLELTFENFDQTNWFRNMTMDNLFGIPEFEIRKLLFDSVFGVFLW